MKESVRHLQWRDWTKLVTWTVSNTAYRVKNFTRKKFEVKKKTRQNLVYVAPPPPQKKGGGGGGGGLFPIVCLFIF